MTFNPEKHLMELQGKAYLEVKWRLVWFRQECPNGTIDTEEVIVDLDREVEAEIPTGNWIANPNRPGKKMPEKVVKSDKGYARFRAIVTDGKGGRATATKSENAASFPDYIEKAETGAVGRALAMLGYGTQFTGDELNEEHRIVDAPVERANGFQYASNGSAAASSAAGNKSEGDKKPASITEQQAASLRKLCQHLGKPEPEQLEKKTYLDAKELILSLSKEYNEQRQSRKAGSTSSESEQKPRDLAYLAKIESSPPVSTEQPSTLVAALVPAVPTPQETPDAAGMSEEMVTSHELLAQAIAEIGGPTERQHFTEDVANMPPDWYKNPGVTEAQLATWITVSQDWENEYQQAWRNDPALDAMVSLLIPYSKEPEAGGFGKAAFLLFRSQVLSTLGVDEKKLKQLPLRQLELTQGQVDAFLTELQAASLEGGVLVSPRFPLVAKQAV